MTRKTLVRHFWLQLWEAGGIAIVFSLSVSKQVIRMLWEPRKPGTHSCSEIVLAGTTSG
jgi:hypothetical protein